MNKEFNREVMKLRPSWRESQGHFYVLPVEHILAGFVYERGSGGAYIWGYAFPLYDHADFIHLAFGDRLPRPGGFIDANGPSPAEEAREFLKRVEEFEEETYAWREIHKFHELVKNTEGQSNPWITRTHALTCIMLGQGDDAKCKLQALSEKSGFEHYPHFYEDINQVLTELTSGVERAKEKMLAWEVDTKVRFGIPG